MRYKKHDKKQRKLLTVSILYKIKLKIWLIRILYTCHTPNLL